MPRRNHTNLENASLRERAALFETLLQQLSDPVWVKSPDGVYLFANRAFAQLFRLDPEGICARRDAELLPAALARSFEQHDQAMCDHPIGRELEQVFIDPDSQGNRMKVIPVRGVGPDRYPRSRQ